MAIAVFITFCIKTLNLEKAIVVALIRQRYLIGAPIYLFLSFWTLLFSSTTIADQTSIDGFDCAAVLLSTNQALNQWGHGTFKFQVNKQETRKVFLIQHMNKHPLLKPMLEAAAPTYLADLVYPNPKELLVRFRAYLQSLGIPQELWVVPGYIAEGLDQNGKKTYKAFSYDQEPPMGFKMVTGILPTNEFLMAIDSGVLPMILSDEYVEQFDAMGAHHDLGHLSSMTYLPYLKAVRRYTRTLLEFRDDEEIKLRFNDYVLNKLNIQDFFEESIVIPPPKIPKLNQFLGSLKPASGQTLSVDTDATANGHNSTPLNLLITSKEQLKELNDLQNKYLDLRAATNQAPENKKLKLEFQNVIAKISALALPYQKILGPLKEVVNQSIVTLGGAVADGISYRAVHYENGEALNIFNKLKSLEILLSSTGISEYGLRGEDVERLINHIVASLIMLAKSDLERTVDDLLDGVLKGQRSWIQEEP